MLRILQSIYATATPCVKVSNNCANFLFPGVRPGCNLSVLLFSLFTSSFETILKTNKSGVELNIRGRVLDLLMYNDNVVLIIQYGSTVYIGIAMIYPH